MHCLLLIYQIFQLSFLQWLGLQVCDQAIWLQTSEEACDSPWHMVPKRLCKQASAKKHILHHGSFRHGALCCGTVPWLQHNVTTSPFLCDTQGKAQLVTCQLPSQSAVFLEITGPGAVWYGVSREETQTHA